MYPKFKVFVDKILMPLSIDVQGAKDGNIIVRLRVAHIYVNE
jgi:hypothetical protein